MQDQAFMELKEKYRQDPRVSAVLEEAYKLVKESKAAYLSSVNEQGYPHARAMLKAETEGLSAVWFSTNTSSPKVKQFLENKKACVLFTNNDTFHGLTLFGDMEVLQDAGSKERLWHAGDEMYYPLGVTDPDYCVLKLNAQWASYYHNLGVVDFAL